MSEDLTNAGTLEMQDLIGFLVKNGYNFEGVEEANYLENGRRYTSKGYTISSFQKSPIEAFTNIPGNDVNDSRIKIKIIYDNNFDNLQKEDTYYDKKRIGDEDDDEDDDEPEYEYEQKTNLSASKKFIKRLIKGKTLSRGGTTRRRRK
jgi:hypothetical protein